MKFLFLLCLLTPAARADSSIALLWAPAEDYQDWESVDSWFDRDRDLKLTIAVAAGSLPPRAQKILIYWAEKRRLEIAMRLKGDPILPLIADHLTAPRSQDVINRLFAEREPYQMLVGTPPSGFMPGGGAVNASLLPAFRALSLSWVACGEYTSSSGTWASHSGTTLVPFTPLPPALSSGESGQTFIADEAGGIAPERDFARFIGELSRQKRGKPRFATVSELVAQRREVYIDASVVARWPTWSFGYDAWASAASEPLWKSYGEAARALERYQNSGAASLRTLESATEDLYRAQAGRFYRGLDGEEFRKILASIYRKIGQPTPEDIITRTGLGASGSSGLPNNDPSVRTEAGSDWLLIENPPSSFSRAPESAAPDPSAKDFWKIISLRLEWTDEGISFIYRMSRWAEPGSPLPRLILDTYVDLNHLPGAGATTLIDGRSAYVPARDAWEFALVMTDSQAYLYQANPSGKSQLVSRLPVSLDAASAEIRTTIPRGLARGNPTRWGYVVLAMARNPEEENRAGEAPRPLPDSTGNELLGLLAPLEAQKAALDGKAESRRRVSALRLGR